MTIELLLASIENDEQRSFAEKLYLDHRQLMISIAYNILGNHDEAEDVLDALEEKSPGFTDEFNAVAFNAVNEDPTVEGAQPEAKNFVITQN